MECAKSNEIYSVKNPKGKADLWQQFAPHPTPLSTPPPPKKKGRWIIVCVSVCLSVCDLGSSNLCEQPAVSGVLVKKKLECWWNTSIVPAWLFPCQYAAVVHAQTAHSEMSRELLPCMGAGVTLMFSCSETKRPIKLTAAWKKIAFRHWRARRATERCDDGNMTILWGGGGRIWRYLLRCFWRLCMPSLWSLPLVCA